MTVETSGSKSKYVSLKEECNKLAGLNHFKDPGAYLNYQSKEVKPKYETKIEDFFESAALTDELGRYEAIPEDQMKALVEVVLDNSNDAYSNKMFSKDLFGRRNLKSVEFIADLLQGVDRDKYFDNQTLRFEHANAIAKRASDEFSILETSFSLDMVVLDEIKNSLGKNRFLRTAIRDFKFAVSEIKNWVEDLWADDHRHRYRHRRRY